MTESIHMIALTICIIGLIITYELRIHFLEKAIKALKSISESYQRELNLRIAIPKPNLEFFTSTVIKALNSGTKLYRIYSADFPVELFTQICQSLEDNGFIINVYTDFVTVSKKEN